MDRPNTLWTVPNILTVIRICITPVFVAAFVNDEIEVAWWCFIAAGVTDALDGFLARVLKQRTVLGAVLDPLADKILLVTSFLCLGIARWLPNWLVILVVSRDAIIVAGLFLLNFLGVDVKTRIQPSWTSKANTLAQIALVLLVLSSKVLLIESATTLRWLIHAVAGLSIFSGAQYIFRGFEFMEEQ